jgi:hypothetical protein
MKQYAIDQDERGFRGQIGDAMRLPNLVENRSTHASPSIELSL